jgi:hypothetical protein
MYSDTRSTFALKLLRVVFSSQGWAANLSRKLAAGRSTAGLDKTVRQNRRAGAEQPRAKNSTGRLILMAIPA